MKKINLVLDTVKLDFIVQRMTSGQMDYATSQNVSAILVEIQQQANDPELNPRQLNVVEAVKAAQEAKHG